MKLLSYKTSKSAQHIGLLLLRVVFGGIMIPAHGFKKLANFDAMKNEFIHFMGMSSTLSLGLAIFAELLCAILVVMGLMTRWAAIPLIIVMLVALQTNGWEIIGKNEFPFVLGMSYLIILIMGPGKYSLDYLISKKR